VLIAKGKLMNVISLLEGLRTLITGSLPEKTNLLKEGIKYFSKTS
jgi:hypothetical protein